MNSTSASFLFHGAQHSFQPPIDAPWCFHHRSILPPGHHESPLSPHPPKNKLRKSIPKKKKCTTKRKKPLSSSSYTASLSHFEFKDFLQPPLRVDFPTGQPVNRFFVGIFASHRPWPDPTRRPKKTGSSLGQPGRHVVKSFIIGDQHCPELRGLQGHDLSGISRFFFNKHMTYVMCSKSKIINWEKI